MSEINKKLRKWRINPGKVIIFTFLFILIFNFLHTNTVFAQDKLKCELCGKTSWGKYWTYDNATYCDECYKNYPHCYSCGIPVKDPIILDGEHFCQNCYSFKLPKCDGCGIPVHKCWIKKDKNGKISRYCRNCLEKFSDKCSLCGTALIGRYWVINSTIVEGPRKYCEQCKSKGKKCFFCGLLVSPYAKPDFEGRFICDGCSKNLIEKSYDYYPVFDSVKRSFLKMGLKVNNTPTLSVVGFKKLKQLGESVTYSTGDKWGLYKCTKVITGTGADRSIFLKTSDIYVVSRLPRELAFYVITHEYAHAWYEERVVTSRGPVIDEGFAEWVSYHILKDHGMNYLAESLKHKKDIYGEGLRKLLEIERKRGSDGVMDFILE
ncbi:MAG: hypothetical protein LWY06_10005 [Firmicutes bacterium]|nr:hypothetical protein [Bacillota bacterium]